MSMLPPSESSPSTDALRSRKSSSPTTSFAEPSALVIVPESRRTFLVSYVKIGFAAAWMESVPSTMPLSTPRSENGNAKSVD
jgi:hypothetical protein